MAWISNYIYSFLWDLIIHPCPSFNSGPAYLSDYIPFFYNDVYIYPDTKLNAG